MLTLCQFYNRREECNMLNKLDVVNDAINNSEQVDVGGSIGCFIACSGVCLITGMIGAPMAVAAMDLD